MHPAKLQAIGLAVWGRGWTEKLAVKLNVHPVSVRRWACGMCDIPANHEKHIVAMAPIWSLERHKAAVKMLRKIKNPYKVSKKDRNLNVISPVFVKPWRKLRQRAMILEDF